MGIEQLEDGARLQLLIDGVIDYAIYILDLDGKIVSWNSGAQRLKGYKPEEIIGKNFASFFTDADRAAGLPQTALATARKEGRFESEGWRIRKDGTRFWALAVLDAIRDDAGEVIGFAKITRDMTERMQAQQAMQEVQQRLAVSQRMESIGLLSGGIAHDFNNLLMIIMGNLEQAERALGTLGEASTANLQRSIGNAKRGAQRAAALTQRLLAFSRRQPLDPRPLDVNKFIGQMVDFLQRTLGESIEVEAIGAAGLWQIEADPAQLEAALVNLAINARDAMPNGGKLTIEAVNSYLDSEYGRRHSDIVPGQYVQICMTDSGIGMSEEVLNRAFEPFFTTKEIGQGTGLGLSQVYGFVKQSQGHVKIYSEPGLGTTVKIYLPRLAREGAADDADHEELGDVGEGEPGETIVVVEDNDEVRSYVVQTLRGLHYRVVGASSGDMALPWIERRDFRIDLLLTDVVMKGMNGRELANRARELRPALKILFMTGYSRNAIVHHGRVDRDVELLQKPVTQTELATRVRDMLDRAPAGQS